MTAPQVLAHELRLRLGALAAQEERRGYTEVVEAFEVALREVVGTVVERQRHAAGRRGAAPQAARHPIEHGVLDKGANRSHLHAL